jgi:hypothetical protein
MIVNFQVDAGDSIEHGWSQESQELSVRVLRTGKPVRPRAIKLTSLYERPTKPKILSQITLDGSLPLTLSPTEQTRFFDGLWAIDTNSIAVEQGKINVAGITAVSTDGRGETRELGSFRFATKSARPEPVGWGLFLKFIEGCRGFQERGRYGLIVDSELSRLDSFNKRRAPIHEDYVVPRAFQLVYATSDSGRESVFNRALLESDKTATRVLRVLPTREVIALMKDADDASPHASGEFIVLR